MGKALSLEGQTLGELFVVNRAENTKSGKSQWVCKCSCGQTTKVVGSQLRSGKTKSCGCLRAPDLTGQVFGWLTVLEKMKVKGGRQTWKARCRCGQIVRGVTTSDLTQSESISCGCKPVGHGMSYSPEYIGWRKLRANHQYPNEWDDFVQFFCDVGERPSPNHELSRRDLSKPHSKENTYWRNANDERAVTDQLTSADLPNECIFDFRSHLRAAASANQREAAA